MEQEYPIPDRHAKRAVRDCADISRRAVDCYPRVCLASVIMTFSDPSLASLNDDAALGIEQKIDPGLAAKQEHALIARRYTKPCARFMNGVRVGFGFALERTCRPHSCKAGDGCNSSAESLMHRNCRMTEFKRHQDVILRNKQAVHRDEERLGRVSRHG